jgi:hypothetical protein
MASLSYDYVFPAADSLSAKQAIGTTTIDTAARIKEINSAESDSLLSSLNGAIDNSSQALTYGMYMYRNKTISDIAADLTNKNNSINNGASETYARQGEINEWEAQNKLDTFFFLQCLFLYLSLLIVIIFLERSGFIPFSTLYIIGGILTVILVGILWNRAYYTSKHRDKRFWNRRYLGLKDGGVTPPPPSCSNS